MANSVDPDQTGSMLFASILDLSVMLGNYLQQTTSADDILDAFFLGALRLIKYLRLTYVRNSNATKLNVSDKVLID